MRTWRWDKFRFYPELGTEGYPVDNSKLVAADDVAALEAVADARKTALEFAAGAIADAIHTENGLDGAAGEVVLRIIVEAIEHGTFDAPGDIADFLTKQERARQDYIAKLEQQVAELRAEKHYAETLDSEIELIPRLHQAEAERDALREKLAGVVAAVTHAEAHLRAYAADNPVAQYAAMTLTKVLAKAKE